MDKKFGYRVEIESECQKSSGEPGPWGHWEARYSQRFIGVERDDENPDIASDLEIEKGEECYVVWLTYSTGDSFGQAIDNETAAIGIFRDFASADQLSKAVWSRLRLKDKDRPTVLEIKTDDGQTIRLGPSWEGTFNVLSEVDVERATLGVYPKRMSSRTMLDL